ncbi:hypothetical protein HanIR_Chr15g0748391 [Helianthus annuus]|nr:hypothetical protein HanIR_Chr15g0748391 [Helianthus annuus]
MSIYACAINDGKTRTGSRSSLSSHSSWWLSLDLYPIYIYTHKLLKISRN